MLDAVLSPVVPSVSMHPPTIMGGKHCVYGLSVRTSVRSVSVYAQRDISVLSGWISMKLGTNIHHASGHC